MVAISPISGVDRPAKIGTSPMQLSAAWRESLLSWSPFILASPAVKGPGLPQPSSQDWQREGPPDPRERSRLGRDEVVDRPASPFQSEGVGMCASRHLG